MPRGDGTGPMGMGSMTGRGAGFCAGLASPGCENPVGFTARLGCGRGFRHMSNSAGFLGRARYCANAMASVSADDEKELLNRQASFLENQLKQVKKRISSFDDAQ